MLVRQAVLYDLEMVALTKRQEAELEVSELNMLRFSLGVARLDRIRSEHIRGKAQAEFLGDKIGGKASHGAMLEKVDRGLHHVGLFCCWFGLESCQDASFLQI